MPRCASPGKRLWRACKSAKRCGPSFYLAEGEISTRCAKCHSTLGHLDFLGVDGTDAIVVDNVRFTLNQYTLSEPYEYGVELQAVRAKVKHY